MDVRQILDDRRTAQLEIRAIQKQIADCLPDGRPTGYPSARQPEKVKGKDEYVMPLPGTNDPMGTALENEDFYRATLDKLLANKQLLFLTVETIIASLSDGEARTILRYYYCQAWTDEAIAAELGRGGKTIWRKRNETLILLEINEDMAINAREMSIDDYE